MANNERETRSRNAECLMEIEIHTESDRERECNSSITWRHLTQHLQIKETARLRVDEVREVLKKGKDKEWRG